MSSKVAVLSSNLAIFGWEDFNKLARHNGDTVWVNGPDGFYLDGNNRQPTPDAPFIYTYKPGRYIFNLFELSTGVTVPVFFQICAKKGQR